MLVKLTDSINSYVDYNIFLTKYNIYTIHIEHNWVIQNQVETVCVFIPPNTINDSGQGMKITDFRRLVLQGIIQLVC